MCYPITRLYRGVGRHNRFPCPECGCFVAPHPPAPCASIVQAWAGASGARRARVSNVVGLWIGCPARERQGCRCAARTQRSTLPGATGPFGRVEATRRVGSARFPRANGTSCWRGNGPAAAVACARTSWGIAVGDPDRGAASGVWVSVQHLRHVYTMQSEALTVRAIGWLLPSEGSWVVNTVRGRIHTTDLQRGVRAD